jgi:hypothetical protein
MESISVTEQEGAQAAAQPQLIPTDDCPSLPLLFSYCHRRGWRVAVVAVIYSVVLVREEAQACVAQSSYWAWAGSARR